MKIIKTYSLLITLFLSFSAHGAEYSLPKLPHLGNLHINKIPAPALLYPIAYRSIASISNKDLPVAYTKKGFQFSPYALPTFSRASQEILSSDPTRMPAALGFKAELPPWEY